MRSCIGVVVVVETIESPWQDYGKAAESVTGFRILNSEKATASETQPNTKLKLGFLGYSA